MKALLMRASLLLFALLVTPACGVEADAPGSATPARESLCARAAEHVAQCSGVGMSLGPQCDEAAAKALLDQSCEDLADPGKADAMRNWLCSLGFLYQCPAPSCTYPPQTSEQLAGTSRCAAYIGVGGCAECDYYKCRDEKRPEPCGSEGYYMGFARRYCLLFTENTAPRMSIHGKRFIEAVRPCLQEEVDILSDTANCQLVKDYGYSIHPQCYVDAGFCELPLTDMLAILNTVAPLDLGTQPFTTAIDCLKRWMNPLTMELTTEGWEQLEAEAQAAEDASGN